MTHKPMSRLIALMFACLIYSVLNQECNAQSKIPNYVHHDVSKVLVVEGDGDERSYSLDVEMVDTIIKAITPHARNYPPRFASKEDETQARDDAGKLSIVLKKMTETDDAETTLFHHSSILHCMAHNMGMKTAAAEADRCFEILLERIPDNGQTTYLYGTFLVQTNRTERGIELLEKAEELEFDSATFTLGMAYAVNGEKEKSLKKLADYIARHPDDENAKGMLKAVQEDRIKKQKTKSEQKSDR